MSEINDGGPAFPQTETSNGQPMHVEFASAAGMSLRDWFAGTLDQAALPEFTTIEDACEWMGCKAPRTQAEMVDFSLRLCARMRYAMADAMIAERENRRG